MHPRARGAINCLCGARKSVFGRRRKSAPGRWNQVLKALIAVGLLLVGSSSSFAEEQLVPSWMTFDAGAQKVAMDVVAGFNPNNSSWNFNGYYEGDMTVVVPEGWRV